MVEAIEWLYLAGAHKDLVQIDHRGKRSTVKIRSAFRSSPDEIFWPSISTERFLIPSIGMGSCRNLAAL